MPRKEGQFFVEDFHLNTGGLNTADSPFVVDKSEATGGKNFDYIKRGGIRRRAGHAKLNSSADTQLKTLGLGLWSKPGTTREVIRAAGRKLQNFDFNAFTFTNLTEDTTAGGSDFLGVSATQPVVSTMFNTPAMGALWHAGGGVTSLWGVYSDTKVTKNGVPSPTASVFTATPGAGAGTIPTGTYIYTLVYRKASTQALSNAAIEASASVTLGQEVTLAWTLTNNDTAKYDKIYVYRSVTPGVTGFTAGSLVAIVNSSATGYVDTGTVVSSSESVPRANSILDNSELPLADYKTVTLFKRRLVTAVGSTLYLSDINKPESWPSANLISVPSGGDITALAVISITSATSSEVDELLCVFKQSEFWIVSGNSVADWVLKYIDNSGSVGQASIVAANGYLAWLNYRGAFLWNGSGKPSYVSQPIEDQFQRGGDIDKSTLQQAFGLYAQGRSEVQWYLSDGTNGEQKYALKLDVRLTLQGNSDAFGNKVLKGVFTPDALTSKMFAGMAFLPSGDAAEELIYLGDDSGFIYSAYSTVQDGATDVAFEYVTPFLTFGEPGKAKRASKIVVWVQDTGVYDLTVDFWSDWRFSDDEQSSQKLPVSANFQGTSFIWDQGDWDEVYWDQSSQRVKALTYNLNSVSNNTEGDVIRLRLRQPDAVVPITVYGFSIYYTELGTRK